MFDGVCVCVVYTTHLFTNMNYYNSTGNKKYNRNNNYHNCTRIIFNKCTVYL